MEITYDKEADALYIYFNAKNNNIAETKGEWPIHSDFSKEGKLIGIEILQASKLIEIEKIKKLKFKRIDKK